MQSSPLGALTKGTPHRRDKGADPEYRVQLRQYWKRPVRERLVEVIGAQPFRAQAKRRKALRMGKPALSGEALYSSGVRGVLATEWLRSLLALPEAFFWVPRKR